MQRVINDLSERRESCKTKDSACIRQHGRRSPWLSSRGGLKLDERLVPVGAARRPQKVAGWSKSRFACRRPHFLRRRRLGHPFYVIVGVDDRRDDRMWWFVFIISIASIPFAGRMAGARKVVSNLALDGSLRRAIGAAGTPDPW
jgi:hypothetical protein